MRKCTRFALAALIVVCSVSMGRAIPQLINYQGILTDGGGTPITVSTNVEFRIWDMSAAGTELWMETQSVTPDSDGRFNVLLGAVNPIPDSALAAADAYLGLTISPDAEMSPRTQLVSVAYAFRPGTVDRATGGNIISKVSIGPGHTNTGDHAFVAGENNIASGRNSVVSGGGGPFNQFFSDTNYASGNWSTVGGGKANTASGSASTVGGGRNNTASVQDATVGGGTSNTASDFSATVGGGSSNTASSFFSTVGGGKQNRARGPYSVVAGGGGSTQADSNSAIGESSSIIGGRANIAVGNFSTVSGGKNNRASGDSSTVSGGVNNTASGSLSTVAGGNNNTASNDGSTVGGGSNNLAIGDVSTVGGGLFNTAFGDSSTVGGGFRNLAIGHGATVGGGVTDTASGRYSTVCGGQHNTASSHWTTVGGGLNNRADGFNSTVGGGQLNIASNVVSTVSGGQQNTASGDWSTIGGGTLNTVGGVYSTVDGGAFNTASDSAATVGGGRHNRARGIYSVVAGGGGGSFADSNSAIGEASAIPGGRRNVAAGDFSFAAGLHAQANHDGCFVWADSTDADFASTAEDQFLIRAGGGVGINKTDPQAPLDIKSSGAGNEVLRLSMDRTWAFRQFSSSASTSLELVSVTPGNLKDFLITTEGNVGISTTNPSEKLHVVGNICATGTIATCSDARFKQNVATIDRALDRVARLRGVRFDWRNDEFPEYKFPTTTGIGLIAQEVETVMPEVVNTATDGVKSVEYANLVALLIEGMKEQQKHIENLEQRLLSVEREL